ncbi:PepSY domain-containing protein [Duganella hordei]|uniref:PepSY domain-containing protein n=1 Tax=Duganella hordei TaxID=2865934 RepID=UPI0030EA0E81
MPNYRTMSVIVAGLLAAGGVAFAATRQLNETENDALAAAKAPVTLMQALSAAEKQANGRATRGEYEPGKAGARYEIEVVSGAKAFDIKIDASSGKVLSSVEDRADRGEHGEHDEE